VPPAVDRYGDPLPAGALLRLGTWRLGAHGKVSTVLFSPNGKTIVSAAFSAEKKEHTSIRVWDADTGSLVRAFGTEGFEWHALGPDGHTLAAALSRTDIHLFDLRTGEKIAMLEHSEKNQQGSVRGIAFAADGKTLTSFGLELPIQY
jgi:WD40 repeat protein